ncbi:MAG: Murein DD-endopeptidase MepM [Alphaproteobacteria bacterium MarineAlpha9_Bin4]|nr:peptidase M23 [Pelagibacterales bacterium]PPR26651.1 MAG: Murein DD-endopeptidase MepM [Alphaproteobacteria bacterium MarineAlpha9_Bin4]|tara:strand:+ start:337 stop:1176 length:840 start_codon:yes stop_codon:yes gene_type:complete
MQKLRKLNSFKVSTFFLLTIIFIKINNYALCFDLKGNFIQGGLLVGKLSVGDALYYNGKKIPIDETGEFIIGIGRKHPNFGNIKIVTTEKKEILKNIEIKQRKYNIQKINNLKKSKVTPPAEFYDRIKLENRRIKKAKATNVEYSHYHAGFIMPAEGILTGVYGSQRILNGIPKRPHYGIDIANKIGSPILAPSDGIVVMVEKDLYFSGGTIIISHGRGLTSSLLHLKKILVEPGSFIKKGELIGLMGDTGRATGSHLDWRMELRGVRIDPYLLIKKKE